MLRFGSLLHMAAVVTDAALPGDPVKKEQPCPSDCSACHGICPSEAFDANGKFNQMTCVQYAVEHAIYPLALKNELGRKYIERVVNTAGHNYWLACNECLSFISCFRAFVIDLFGFRLDRFGLTAIDLKQSPVHDISISRSRISTTPINLFFFD